MPKLWASEFIAAAPFKLLTILTVVSKNEVQSVSFQSKTGISQVIMIVRGINISLCLEIKFDLMCPITGMGIQKVYDSHLC